MSEYEKQDEEEDEYVQNVENFQDVAYSKTNYEDYKRSYGGRDFDVEETIGERFLGLTEMFPECLRSAGGGFFNCLERCFMKTYCCICNLSWIAFASTAILFAPVVYEYERTKDEARTKESSEKSQ